MEPGKIVMGGSAWLIPSILSKSRAKFISDNMKSPYVFPGYKEETRRELLGQVYDLAKKK